MANNLIRDSDGAPVPLPADRLRAGCSPERLGFHSTEELAPLDGVIGQDRALSAAAFGLGMRASGYNVFVAGSPGTGKASSLGRILDEVTRGEPVPPDHCYVYNFADAYRPQALALPPGRGRRFAEMMARVATDTPVRLSRAFEGDEFARRRQAVVADLEAREQASLHGLEEVARRAGFTVLQSDDGIQLSWAPEGRAVDVEEIERLPVEERHRIEELARTLEGEMAPLVRGLRQLQRDAEALRQHLLEETAGSVARDLLAEVREAMADVPAVGPFLDALARDLAAHATLFVEQDDDDDADDETEADEDGEPTSTRAERRTRRYLDRCRVNLFVDRAEQRGAPVVLESNPTYRNLFGRIEHRAHLGTLTTDFTQVKAGAVQRANGGYLLLEAKDVVAEPAVWDALKRALKSRSIRLEEPNEEPSLLTVASLLPQPIPSTMKVILLGTPALHQLLYEEDDDFRELFKVKVEFDDSLPRTDDNERLVGRFVAGLCRRRGLRHFRAAAVARLIEHSARTAEHQGRLSARFGDLADLVEEAAYLAGRRGESLVDADDVRRAIQQRLDRESLVEEQLARMTDDGEIVVATAGEVVGQVNGLEVLSLAGRTFGRPLRVTARARPGRPGLVDVEREVGLGGPIHSKGVLILGGYLAGRYAPEQPLAMSASLVCEQSYGPFDGDSASCAELCALLSALAGVPLTQSLALSGSVDQHGDVQPVGAINEKVEGFFDLCRRRGLSGAQGVLIPARNLHHLMLREDIVEAVRAGRFRILAMETVDQALELLTGRSAGTRDDDGRFPEGSINAAVERRLIGFARSVTRAHE